MGFSVDAHTSHGDGGTSESAQDAHDSHVVKRPDWTLVSDESRNQLMRLEGIVVLPAGSVLEFFDAKKRPVFGIVIETRLRLYVPSESRRFQAQIFVRVGEGTPPVGDGVYPHLMRILGLPTPTEGATLGPASL
jgi:hypothetical protein